MIFVNDENTMICGCEIENVKGVGKNVFYVGGNLRKKIYGSWICPATWGRGSFVDKGALEEGGPPELPELPLKPVIPDIVGVTDVDSREGRLSIWFGDYLGSITCWFTRTIEIIVVYEVITKCL